MEHFTPLSALIGGLLIGTAACVLMWINGRVAGVTGIVKRVWPPVSGDVLWRVAFVLGLILGAGVYFSITGEGGVSRSPAAPVVLIVAGVLTGWGTAMGNGCTSGHGVCGLARLSKRSIVATACFLVAGVITTGVVRHVFGGAW
ncbi:MAG: hypothetical protein RL357_312 [Pseudomonadota bacterium]